MMDDAVALRVQVQNWLAGQIEDLLYEAGQQQQRGENYD